MASQTPPPATVFEVVEELAPPGTPLTTSEVAAEFDCTDRTIYNKLDALVDVGDLETKKVGARGRVWWRPVGDHEPARHDSGATVTESTFRRLFENVPGLYLIVEPEEYEIVAVSDAYLDATMTERAEIMGKTLFEVFPADPDDPDPEGVPRLRGSLERVKAEQETDVMPVTFYPIPRPDAEGDEFEDRWWSPTNAPVVDESGDINYIIHRVQDVTPVVRRLQADGGEAVLDRLDTRDSHLATDIMLRGQELHEAKEAAYERLQENEARLNAFVTATSEVVYRMSPDWSELTELEGRGFIADTNEPRRAWFEEYIPPDEQPRVKAAIDEAIETKSTFELEHQILQVDGTRGWVHSRAVPILDEDGDIVEWFGTATDVTERKRAHERVRRQNTVLEGINRIFSEALTTSSAEELGRVCLDVAEEVTGSAFSFVGERDDETGHLDVVAISDRGWEVSAMDDFRWPEGEMPVGFEIHGLYGRVLVDGEGLFTNDPPSHPDSVGTPPGHPPLDSFLGVPLERDGETVGMVGLANREGGYREADLAAAEALAPAIQQAFQSKRTEDALRESEERFRAVANLVPDLLWSNDSEGSVQWYNQQWYDYTGLTPDEARGDGWLDVVHPDDRERSLESFRRATAAGESLREEVRIRRNDGEYRWFLVQAQPVEDGDGDVARWFGAATDVHEARTAKAGLERLTAASRELMEADATAIADRVAALTRRVLGAEHVSLWRYDGIDGHLRPHDGHADADVGADGIRYPEGFDDRIWEVFVSGDVVVADDHPVRTGTDGSPLRSCVLVPLGRHGVVCAGSTQPGAFDERRVELAATLGTTVETAWDRAAGERELADSNEELRRLDRLNTLIRETIQVLVEADTVDAIDEAVCERLADSDLYAFAWVGEYDAVDGAVEPRAWAGVAGHHLDTLTATTDERPTDVDAFRAAIETGEPQVVADVATDARAAPWRECALDRGARSCLCIPLVYEESVYGVLTVYGERPQRDERDVDVLAELGRTMAHAINAVETKATLRTDSVVELTLRSSGATTPLCRLARDLDCHLEFEGLVPGAGGDHTVFFSAADVPAATLLDAGERTVAVEDLTCLADDGVDALFRMRTTDRTLASLLLERDVVIRSLSIDAGTATAVIDLFQTDEVREVVDAVETTVPDVTLLARRSQNRPIETRETFQRQMEERLTDRQREVLGFAYRSGFFRSPRVQTGAELSAALDVSQSTFTHHLREAQRKLFEMVFDAP